MINNCDSPHLFVDPSTAPAVTCTYEKGPLFLPVFDGLMALVIYKLMMLRSCCRRGMNGEVRSDETVILQRSPRKKLQFTISFLDSLAVKTSHIQACV